MSHCMVSISHYVAQPCTELDIAGSAGCREARVKFIKWAWGKLDLGLVDDFNSAGIHATKRHVRGCDNALSLHVSMQMAGIHDSYGFSHSGDERFYVRGCDNALSLSTLTTFIVAGPRSE